MTGDPRYLSTAVACAEYYLNNTSFAENAPFGPGVPPNDWDEARYGEGSQAESSAAAITASGLFSLSKLVPDPVYASRYRNAALIILKTLTSPDYLANETPGWEGILKHGSYHQRKGLGVDESVMWGEFFFVEALQKALNLKE
jgi:unsaturated chondroitin disaccharide hydrolase